MRELYPTKLHAFFGSQFAVLEERDKARDLAEEAARDALGQIEFHYQGSLIRFGPVPGWEPYERERKTKRGKIGGFTRKARSWMMEFCAKIRSDAPALFVTLTYPRAWPLDPSRWKRDLDAFGKWLRRTEANASALWKLEPQQRGAPHFHLLVWGVEFLAHQLLSQRWYEIVGSNDPAHLAAEPVSSVFVQHVACVGTPARATWEKNCNSRKGGRTSEDSGGLSGESFSLSPPAKR